MDSSKQIAAGITFLLCGAIVVFLMLAKLAWDPARPWPPKPDPYIEMTFDEEFVDVVELPKPRLVNSQETAAPAQTPEDLDNPSRLAPETGTNLANAGKTGESPAKVVTSDRPSTVQAEKKEQPKNTGPTVDTKKQRDEATSKRSKAVVNNAFAKAKNKGNANNKNGDEGKAGKTTGDPKSAGSAKSDSTKPVDVTGLDNSGWQIPAYSKNIPSNEVGMVQFEVPINPDGSVGKIVTIKNSGLSEATIARCKAEINRHRYVHTGKKPAQSTTATVTFRFKDPK